MGDISLQDIGEDLQENISLEYLMENFITGDENLDPYEGRYTSGTSFIHIAVAEEDVTTLESFMSSPEFNINIQDKLGQTPLMIAIRYGHNDVIKYTDVIKLLLGCPNLDINMEDDDGNTALVIACYNGYETVVEMLLCHKQIQVNKVGFFRGENTPLEIACIRGHQGVVRILLARDDINTYTALMACCVNGHRNEVLRILLDYEDLDINLPQESDIINYDDMGRTPLIMACKLGHKEVVQLLLGCPKLDVNMADDEGNTALLMACREPLWHLDRELYLGIVRLLLTRDDINVNAQNKDKSTALKMACQKGTTEVISMLLKRDEIQMSDQNIEAVVDFVMKRQMDIKDKRDMNAVIDEAVFKNLLDIARWLIKTQGYLSRAYTDMAGLCRSKRRCKRTVI